MPTNPHARTQAVASRWQPQAGTFYGVPTGGGFQLVSCPHFLGEIIIYLGLAIVCEGRAMTLLVLAWVVRSFLFFC
jgi:hypothetical protein